MVTRRNFFKNATLATGGAVLASSASASALSKSDIKPKVLVVGAHPDDPETGAGGTICKYTEAGYEVVVLYLTTGEAGIEGISHEDAAKIRKLEAEKACKIMNVRPVFFGQIDGACEITPKWYKKMSDFLEKEQPDIIFNHWPIDSHRDHRISSNLVYDAWYNGGRKASLYYYEVCVGAQSQNFHPNTFVDIGSVLKTKWEACFIHESQKIREYYPTDHEKMEIYRGMEYGVKYAEGFVHHSQSSHGLLP